MVNNTKDKFGQRYGKAMSCIVIAFAVQAALAATYSVDIDRPSGIYRCGEMATFTVKLLSTNHLAAVKTPYATLDDFGTTVFTNMPFNVTATGVVFTASGTLRKPGFLRLVLPKTENARADPHVFSVGFEPEKIMKGSPSPADFDEFWAAARARLAREVPLDPQVVRVPERSTAEFDFYRISFATFGRRVHGYMSVPTNKAKAPFPVDFGVNAAGFGGWTNDMRGEKNSIRVQFSVYPFPPDWRWKENGLEAKYKAMDAEAQSKYGVPRYCLSGIAESREAYFFYPVILGIDRAVDWVAARPDVDRSRFCYQGTSQGGGFGFYLCGLNRSFTRAAFYVPAITDTMGYLKGRKSGWPEIVENNSSTPERRAAAERYAPYFDGANFASRITCPVRVAVGFSDTTCPPCAVYAAYNEIKVADKAIGHGIGMTHSCHGRFYKQFGAWTKSKEQHEVHAQPLVSEQVEEKIRGLMDENRTAGMAVVLVKGNKVIFQKAFGYRDIDTREPLDVNDIFRIASISKSFSGMSIMQLVEAGKLSLDDDVNNILGMDIRNPRYPDVPVTIKMLLSHTSSMNDGGGYRDLTYVDKTKTDIKLIREKAWLSYPPGKGYKYCNRALNIIGLVIEKVSCERFDEYVLNHILKPIGADNAGFNLDKLDESTFTKLYFYDKKHDKLVPGGGYKRINEQKVADGTYKIGTDGCYWSPTGGMKMSAPNLAKWMLTLKNGGVAPNGNRIISEKGCRTLLTPVTSCDDPGTQYCLTTRVETRLVAGKKLVGHTGGAYGLLSCMYFCPDEDWGVVCICSSAKPDKVVKGIRKCHHQVVNLLYDQCIKTKQNKKQK